MIAGATQGSIGIGGIAAAAVVVLVVLVVWLLANSRAKEDFFNAYMSSSRTVSKSMKYVMPEQPPPCTPRRRP